MKHFGVFCVLAAFLFLAGCTSFEDRVTDVQARLSALEDKGLPDSLVSPIRMALITAQGDKQRRRSSDADKNIRVAQDAAKRAEEFLEKSLTETKPQVTAARNDIARRVQTDLTGMHKREADSLIAVIDSLLGINFVFRAQNIAQQLERDYPKMQQAQVTADSLRPLVRGTTWIFRDTAKNIHDRNVNAVETKTFTFNRDGTARYIHEKRGQSAPNLREDWRFETHGNWDMKGDVIHIITTRWVGHEQRAWIFNDATRQWGHVDPHTNRFLVNVPSIVPAEVLTSDDEEISKQNLFIAFGDLQRQFRRR